MFSHLYFKLDYCLACQYSATVGTLQTHNHYCGIYNLDRFDDVDRLSILMGTIKESIATKDNETQCIEQLYKNIFEQQELFDQKVIVEVILRLFVAALA